MNTTTNNMKQVSYTGPYNSNGFIGVEEYCSCVPTDIGYNYYSVQEMENLFTINSTFDYSIEQTFWFYFPTGQTGTNCGTQYTNAHWFDVEVFMARNASSGITPHYPSAGWDYNGCGSTTPTTITYREVWNQSAKGQMIQWTNFAIRAPAVNSVPGFKSDLLSRGLAFQGLPLNTQTLLAGIEIGTENFGAIIGSTWLQYSLAASLPGPDTFNDPDGTLTMIQPLPFMPYNGTDNAQNDTMKFDVAGIENLQPPLGVVFTVSTSGALTVEFVGSKPVVLCKFCSQSYSSNVEKIVYAGGISDGLTVMWSPSSLLVTATEPQTVLFRDDFLYTNPYVDSFWTIDQYNNPGRVTGEYTSSGYLIFRANSVGTETAHVTNSMYNPAVYSTGTAVKRKMTVALIPFSKTESPFTANILTGFAPLFSTGAYPGTQPAGTPNADNAGTCAASPTASDNIGTEFLAMNNAGTVVGIICGDPSGTRGVQTLETGLNPTLYTVFTIETYGIFCSTCTDNAYTGSSWVWFRVYQEDSTGRIITSTDKNVNVTSNIAPLFQTAYAFVSQTNSNSGATLQTSEIDFVSIQNYGSPVCLVAPGGFLCTRLPPVPNGIIGNNGLVGLLAWLANQIGFGDEQTGAILLFLMLSFGIGFAPWFFTRNLSVGAFGEMLVLGFFTYVGFLPIWTLIIVFMGGAAMVVMIVMRFMGGATMGSSSGGME